MQKTLRNLINLVMLLGFPNDSSLTQGFSADLKLGFNQGKDQCTRGNEPANSGKDQFEGDEGGVDGDDIDNIRDEVAIA